MEEEKTINISLNIANVAPMELIISPNMVPLMNKCAEGVNFMWSRFSAQYPEKKSADIIAMVALRYAQAYYMLAEEQHQQQAQLADALKQVDDILIGIE